MKKFKRLFLVSVLAIASLTVSLLAIRKATNNKAKAASIPEGCTLDAAADVVSVKDLTFNTLTNQTALVKNNTQGTYSKANVNGSVVFKFKYDVLDATKTDKIEFRINLDVANEQSYDNTLWIRGDGVYLKAWNGTKLEWNKKDSLSLGLHEIEYGRKAVIGSDSVPTGSYYVYYMVDGVEVNSFVYDGYDASKMDGIIYFDAYTGENMVYDVSYGTSFTYEAPQYVSVSNLISGNELTSGGAHEYSKANAPLNNSVSFIAYAEHVGSGNSNLFITAPNDGTDYNWDKAGLMVFTNDSVVLYPNNADGNREYDIEDTPWGVSASYKGGFAVGTTRLIEYSRQAILNNDGTFSGFYHTYVKVDNQLLYSLDHKIYSPICNGGVIHATAPDHFLFKDAYQYETPKYVSISSMSSSVEETTNIGKGYNTDNLPEYKSTSFVANLEVVESNFHSNIYITAPNDGTDYNWKNEVCIALLDNKAVLYTNNADGTKSGNTVEHTYFSDGSALVPGQTYLIEYGRKAQLVGNKFTGLYHVYLKINGNEILSYDHAIAAPMVNGGFMHVTGLTDDGGVQKLKYKDAFTYEDAKYISVSDLSHGGAAVGTEFIPQASSAEVYTFDNSNHTSNYSLVFKFDYTFNQSNQNQIHFSGDWQSPSCFLLCNGGNSFHLGKSTSTEGRVDWWAGGSTFNMTAGQTYEVECGRLAILFNGNPTGEYLTFIKVDDNIVTQNVYGVPQTTLESNGILITAGAANTFTNVEIEQPQSEKVPTPEFVSATDGTQIRFEMPVFSWNTSDAVIDFDSSYAQVTVDLRPCGFGTRYSDKLVLSGTLVNGDPTNFYHYHIVLNGMTANNGGDGLAIAGLQFRAVGDYANLVVTGYPELEAADIISVEDLKNGSGVSSNTITLNASATYTYDAKAAHKSVVFKFKYNVVDPSTIDCQFIFNNGWYSQFDTGEVKDDKPVMRDHDSVLWLRSDKNFISTNTKDSYITGQAITTAGEHDVELGKLYITSGDLAGHYLMYIKVDGVYTNVYVSQDAMPDSNAIYMTGKNGDSLKNNIAKEYETPKVIQISDLKLSGAENGGKIDITSEGNYSFNNDNHAQYYSLVFKFNYIVKENTQNQFHISTFENHWDSASSFILNNDAGKSLNFGKSTIDNTNAGFQNISYDFVIGETYEIEFGRLAVIVDGVFTGEYYTYLKVNGEIVAERTTGIPEVILKGNNLMITHGGSNTVQDVDYVEEAYEEAVVISVGDLSYDGQKVGNSYTLTKNTTFTYTADNQHKSTIFKFKYDIKNNGSGFSSQFHFSDGWLGDDHGGIIWFRDDATRISKVGGNYQYVTSNFIPSVGEHDVEIGNLYVTAGANTGKYYIYIIVDGELICEYYQATMPEKASLFISTDDGDTIYDAFYVEPEYEEADVISVSDLMIEGYKIGNELVLDQHHTLEYAATKEHKSVIFKFLYEAYKVEGAIPSSQFHFNNSWISNAGGCIWLQNGFYITKDELDSEGKTTYSQSAGFPSEGLYEVELGKIYVTAGENAGKYRLYIKLNGTVVNEYYVATMPNLAMLFTTGTDGNSIYDVDYVSVEVSSSLYLYKWDVARSGVEFILKVRKDFVELKGISEAGFYLVENNGTPVEVSAKLALDGEYYVAKAAIASIADEHIALNVQATAYVKNENNYNYSKAIKTSLLKELEKVTGLSEDNVQILNAVKAKVLVVSLDEDSCEVVGATKTGDFTTNTLVLTGANAAYSAYVLNGKALQNNDLVYVGYRLYVVTLGENSITLTKAEKKTVFGGSEHFVELNSGHDEDMNARTLAPMTSELGLKTVRTDLYLSNLFDVDENNQLVLNLATKAKVDSVIKELKENGGVENFLAVLWNIAPYEYETDPGVWKSNSTPDPETQAELYLAWLELNREAAREAALLFPEIKYFEAWNEPEILVDKDGHGPMMDCHGNDYPVTKKVRILTDLMYYYNLGIKEANPENVMVSYGSCNINASDKRFAETSQAFLEDVYKEIVNDTPVTGFETADKDPNNYFQVISVHPYLNSSVTKSNWKAWMNGLNAICEEYNDGGTEIWVTEFGFAQNRYETAQADMLTVIGYAEELDFITTFLFYKVHDYTDKIDADRWGLYNYDGTIKAIGTAVKNLINPEA